MSRPIPLELPMARDVATFVVSGEPASKSRARFTKYGSRVHAYTPQNVREAEAAIGWAFKVAAAGHQVDGVHAFGVRARFVCGSRQRRDVDNMLKLVLDGLTGVAWADDNQVMAVAAEKAYGDRDSASTTVTVTLLGPVPTRDAICEHCQKPYATYDSWAGSRRFCSMECQHLWRKAKNRHVCEHCGKAFQRADAGARFCSVTCRRRETPQACVQCGQTFPGKDSTRGVKLCSEACKHAYWRARRAKTAEGTCSTCGGPTSKRAYRQCQACVRGYTPDQGSAA